jgi:putative selenate reductase
MAELQPVPFADLVRRIRREVVTSQAIFDLPVRKWHVPDPTLDFSAPHFGRPASTPVGPAAGPHTQLAQNIVLAWLAGSRIIELKTVQVNDRLEIPRPCIHVPNIGYNVEWSQELLVRESLIEYAKAAYLIEILKSTRAFGVFPTDHGLDTVFDISVGYDLEGIRGDKVTGFIRAMKNPAPLFDALRGEFPTDLAEHRDIDLPAFISDCVTLSTFHGCPADQIEGISRYLLEELGLHTIVKLNPTLLGFDRVREILVDELGYTHLSLRRDAFDVDLQYEDGLEILRRLRPVAENVGSTIGAKFTNTLVVENDPDFFPTQTDPYMYVSGPPLHVISMTLMQRFREDLGFEFPVSFSAGIDVKNFPTAVACGMVPVTTCTDLLRQGGFGRLPGYLRALGNEMKRAGVATRADYVLDAYGHRSEALAAADGLGLEGDDRVLHATRVAGRLNGREIVPTLAANPRYHAESNTKTPRHIESTLALYDCINCDLCISACPNDAVFAYEAALADADTRRLRLGAGGIVDLGAGAGFTIDTAHQLAVFEGACNECSNCEVYCPEQGAPFLLKEQVFISVDAFARETRDGFYLAGDTLHARIGGCEMTLRRPAGWAAGSGDAVLAADGVEATVDWDSLTVIDARATDGGTLELDTADLWRMKTVWESVFASAAPNPVQPAGVSAEP